MARARNPRLACRGTAGAATVFVTPFLQKGSGAEGAPDPDSRSLSWSRLLVELVVGCLADLEPFAQSEGLELLQVAIPLRLDAALGDPLRLRLCHEGPDVRVDGVQLLHQVRRYQRVAPELLGPGGDVV